MAIWDCIEIRSSLVCLETVVGVGVPLGKNCLKQWMML